MQIEFSYIRRHYNVPAEKHREVIVDGKKGVITEDMGSYIGVNFYDKVTMLALACHPTWRVQYLDTFNNNPPIKKTTRSQRRYQEFLRQDLGLSFKQWLGIK
jgi:hypothetical protein